MLKSVKMSTAESGEVDRDPELEEVSPESLLCFVVVIPFSAELLLAPKYPDSSSDPVQSVLSLLRSSEQARSGSGDSAICVESAPESCSMGREGRTMLELEVESGETGTSVGLGGAFR